MSARKRSEADKLDERIKALGSFTEVSKEDIQREYARINRMVQEAGTQLESDGIVVEREVGTANNRHMALVENELLMPYKKLTDLLTSTAKTLDQLKRSPATVEDDDEFSQF